ncbi:MAG TPA: hypothetical protein VFN02_06250 [Ktedonobacteraceae bacterium]|nr:hypothetical protein [Ktedonobacteraceae bacterium]
MGDHNDGNGREERRPRTFNPSEHVIQIKNRGGAADYLPVQWRLVWFREQCPNGTIDTEEVEVDLDREAEEEAYAWNSETRRSEKIVKRARGYARFRAVVTDGKGGRATGTKSEIAASFPDFIEKAETGAIGRALAALGYGTQFAPELNEEHRIVDAPVDRSVPSSESSGNGRGPVASVRPAVTSSGGKANGTGSDESISDAYATEQQLASIRKLCQHLGKPEPEDAETMSYVNAKELITQLSREYNEQKQRRKAS